MLLGKFRKYPIINFSKGMWGMDFWVNRIHRFSNTRATVYGWCSQVDLMRRGTLLIKELDNSFVACRIKSIKWMDDPTDMFFAEVKFIESDRDLTLHEIEFFRKYLSQYIVEDDD